jgi:two-component sensor histidine kinase
VAARTREREAAAERQRLMMQELNHRVKNMLANVLSIASLTARSADDVATYRARLTERVQGLAKTHDLLSGNEWSGADLRELLASELGLYDDEAGRVRLEGPAVHLPPRLAVGVGMIAHELTTNAVKYGALASGTGRVEVAWRVDAEPSGQRRLHLSWTEAGGPPVAQPTRQGFGTRMIERGLARELDATVVSDYALEGLRFTLSMPLEAEGQPVDPRASRRAEYAKLVQEPEGLRIY